MLYEIGRRQSTTAAELARELALDPSYVSRILLKFEQRQLLTRERLATDGRQWRVALTKSGRQSFAAPASSRKASTGYTLRPHRPGDIGWVIHRHGVLYFQEYGWDERFEALVAEIAAKFIQNFDPARERCWIAEQDGAIVGSVFLVRHTDSVAKLRLLLVEPSARGLGLGQRLVRECIDFARSAGYSEITLWTQAELLAARHIYENAGFHLAGLEKHHHFGPEMVGEVWNLTL